MAATIDHYDQNARSYFEQTRDVDMRPLYEPFLAWIPAGGAILDAGCGSGRDTRAFQERGYRVTAIDAAPELARLAEAHAGIAVHVQRLEELNWRDRFDGIWACASLLHLPAGDLPDAFQRLGRALKPGGVLYASFKYGQGEHQREGRHFTDLDADRLAEITAAAPELAIYQWWYTADRRADRTAQGWLNALLQRKETGA
ncbi:MAG TPA: class I SAM-dependent methyltransferase [Gammaproteobacteria bacterium]|nr:class I SAM-dependent methyltransferase [Gammaproteobacteria bacterium]